MSLIFICCAVFYRNFNMCELLTSRITRKMLHWISVTNVGWKPNYSAWAASYHVFRLFCSLWCYMNQFCLIDVVILCVRLWGGTVCRSSVPCVSEKRCDIQRRVVGDSSRKCFLGVRCNTGHRGGQETAETAGSERRKNRRRGCNWRREYVEDNLCNVYFVFFCQLHVVLL